MSRAFSQPWIPNKILGPSTVLPILAVLAVVLTVNSSVVHAESEEYTIILDPNGGSWDTGSIYSFDVSIGNKTAIPLFSGTFPEGTVFAGWSYSDGYADGRYVRYTQTIDYGNGSGFVMGSETAEKAIGNVLTLYAVWIPELVSPESGTISTERVCVAGDTVRHDLSLPYDVSVGGYKVASGSVPYAVPAEYGLFQLQLDAEICIIDSRELFPGQGNLRIVIPTIYFAESGDGSSDNVPIVIEWTIDVVFIDTVYNISS